MIKKEFEEIIVLYKDQISMLKQTIDSLRSDNVKLQEQIFRLNDSLMAVRAPEVYRDYRNDMNPIAEIPDKDKIKMKLQHDLTKAYFTNIEQPLFKGAADMEELLAPVIFGEINESESMHGNDES